MKWRNRLARLEARRKDYDTTIRKDVKVNQDAFCRPGSQRR